MQRDISTRFGLISSKSTKKTSPDSGTSAGQFLYLSVDNFDEAYKGLIAERHKPSSVPKDWPWGNREFVIRDPDGYKLVIFKRK